MMTCILLSAGCSERFGSPKALAKISEKTLIEDLQNTLLLSSCEEIIIVLGHHYKDILPFIFIHSRIRVVYNKHYNFGQTSSVQEAWRHIKDSSKGALFLPVDCPLVKASTINSLIDCFNQTNPDILIPTYQDKKGHPPVFNQRLKSNILNLSMDEGINSLFAQHPVQTLKINDPGIVKSFNTVEEFEELRKSAKQVISRQ